MWNWIAAGLAWAAWRTRWQARGRASLEASSATHLPDAARRRKEDAWLRAQREEEARQRAKARRRPVAKDL